MSHYVVLETLNSVSKIQTNSRYNYPDIYEKRGVGMRSLTEAFDSSDP
jgi:hypothetical protein